MLDMERMSHKSALLSARSLTVLPSIAKNYGKSSRKKEDRLFIRWVADDAWEAYESMVKAVGNPARFMQVERNICLRTLDAAWIRHLANMERLREVIRYQSIGMRDPAVEYRVEAARLFQEMMLAVEDATAEALMALGTSHKLPKDPTEENT